MVMQSRGELPWSFIEWDQKYGRYELHHGHLVEFLRKHGYGKLYVESPVSSKLVRVEGPVVHKTGPEPIKDFVMNTIRKTPTEEIPNGHSLVDIIGDLIGGSSLDFSGKRLRYLPKLDLDFRKDREGVAFHHYDNGFVRVTEEGRELHPYEDLDGKIWASQRVDRKFEKIGDLATLQDSDWFEFLWRAMGEDEDRFRALTSALGYLLHGYKDPALTKAVVFMDEVVSDGDEGRTGKSITSGSLGYLVPGLNEDGRHADFDTRFAFQSVKPEHQFVEFDDAPGDFDFQKLFNVITGKMTVERKNQDPFTIPFEEAPKFVITTNDVMQGEGASFEERIHQIEFAPHYGPDNLPKEELGRRLFDDWSQEQWAKFDNLMMLFVEQFLTHGLQGYRHKNLKRRKIRQETSREFADWFLKLVRQAPGKQHKKDLRRSFLRDGLGVDPDEDRVNINEPIPTQHKVTRWCNRAGKILIGEKLEEKKSGNDRYLVIPSVDEV